MGVRATMGSGGLHMHLSLLLLAAFLISCPSLGRSDITATTCQELNNAIQSFNDGNFMGKVVIPKGKTINATDCGGITSISASIKIVGAGTPSPVITGNGITSLFVVNTNLATLTLSNLVLKGGYAENGGCIYLNANQLAGYFTNMTFEQCTATSAGGAINGGHNPLTLQSVNFDSNQARYGGALSDAVTVATNCKFTRNVALSSYGDAYGGAITSSDQLNISKCVFQDNSVYSATGQAVGGAITFSVPSSISDSTFIGNSVTAPNSIAAGGALHVYQTSGYFVRNTFQKNWAKSASSDSYGGAIYSSGPLSSRFCQYLGNTVYGLRAFGGAVHVISSLTVFSSSFSKNQAYPTGYNGGGGAIYSSSPGGASVVQSNFSSNIVSASGVNQTSNTGIYGGAIFQDSNDKLTVDKNNYIGNRIQFLSKDADVRVNGGGIFSTGDLYTTFSSFQGNLAYSASTVASGGAIYATQSLDVIVSTFTSNNATSACFLPCDPQSWGGGAIYATGNSYIFLSKFSSNTYQQNGGDIYSIGGAIYFFNGGTGPVYTVKSSTFSSNGAVARNGTAGGGAIGANPGNQLFVNNSNFVSNFAFAKSSYGGAIFVGQSSLYTTGSTFSKNAAIASIGDARGGAIDMSFTTLPNYIFFATFNGNSVVSKLNGISDGGSVHFGNTETPNSNPLQVARVVFNGSTATSSNLARGGSLFVRAGHSAILANTVFSNSKSISSYAFGGAIYSGKQSTLNFCAGNRFDSSSYVKSGGGKPSTDYIYTGLLPTVTFCPSITVPTSAASTFNPVLTCDPCDCGLFSPCDSSALCSKPSAAISCVCPANTPGSGFSCGSPLGTCRV